MKTKLENNSSHHEDFIEVTGAREHNLKDISIRIPRNQITVVTGLSGSGKSSLAFEATLQVRNKVMKAYEEIMNMPV